MAIRRPSTVIGVADQRAEQRQRQESVRDGRAERRLGARRAGIDMNPLMIAGRVGKWSMRACVTSSQSLTAIS